MASAVKSIVILAAFALLVPTTLVLTVPITTNNVDTPSSKTSDELPSPLDVNVIYAKDGEYKVVVRALPDVTDVTTTVSLNKVVTEGTDGVEVLKLTKEGEGNVWVSPPIRVKLSDKDVLHLGVFFVQEGAKELQTVHYFEMRIFDTADKLQMIKDGKSTKHLKKRSATHSENSEENGRMTLHMTMVDSDEDGNMQELRERWGAHGGYHGHGGGGGRHHGHRPYPRPNHDGNMDGHHHGHRGSGNGGMKDWGNWHGHGHNQGNNGRWPDRHRPHNHNCHRHGSDESDEDDSNEKPHTKRPNPTTRTPWYSTTISSTKRYTTRKQTTPTRTTTTTSEYPDIDIRFGDGESTIGVPSGDPKPDIGLELPAAV